MKIRYLKALVACWLLLTIFCSSINYVSAQSETDTKKWEFLTDVYLLFPYMNGEIGIGNNITVPVDASPGDIFSKLQMAGMLDFEARTDKWAITTDFVYMNLNQDITPGNVIVSGDVGAKQLIWESAGLYRLAPFWEVGVGGRLNNIATEIDFIRKAVPNNTKEFYKSGSKTWFDPILVTRLSGNVDDKWLFQFRGDLGGFGLGSDFTWQLQAYAGYRISKVFHLAAGIRILGIDYDRGTDTERFIYNVDTSGPVIKLGFNF